LDRDLSRGAVGFAAAFDLAPTKLNGEPELLAVALHDVSQLLAAALHELPEPPLLPAAFGDVPELLSATLCCEVPELLRATLCEVPELLRATLCELPGLLRMIWSNTMDDSVMISRNARWLARAVSAKFLLLPVDIHTSGFEIAVEPKHLRYLQ